MDPVNQELRVGQLCFGKKGPCTGIFGTDGQQRIVGSARQKYGYLYSGLKTTDNIPLYVLINFVFKRLSFLAICFFLRDYSIMQI